MMHGQTIIKVLHWNKL